MVTAQSGHAHLMPGLFLETLGRRLGMPDWYLTGSGIEPRDGQFPTMISVGEYLAIVANMLAAGHRADFVSAATEGIQQIHLTGVMLAMQTAPTLGDALALLVKFGSDRTGLHRFALRRSAGRTSLEILDNTDLGACSAVLAETVVLSGVAYISSVAASGHDACEVRLNGPASSYSTGFAARLACPTRFETGQHALVFPSAFEALHNPGHDAALWEMGRQRCVAEAAQHRLSATAQRLRTRISRALDETGAAPRINDMARLERVSARSLIRHLRAVGLTYQEMVDAVRRDRAGELLARGCSVGTTAELLGYADPSSFRRSYRRWHGVNPSARRAPLTG